MAITFFGVFLFLILSITSISCYKKKILLIRSIGVISVLLAPAGLEDRFPFFPPKSNKPYITCACLVATWPVLSHPFIR
jgi:hypothetical protein